jgi:hypothetical protein
MSNYRKRQRRKNWKRMAEVARELNTVMMREHAEQVAYLRRELGRASFFQGPIHWAGTGRRRILLRKDESPGLPIDTIQIPSVDLQLFAWRFQIDARVARDYPDCIEYGREVFLKQLTKALVTADLIAFDTIPHALEMSAGVYFGKPIPVDRVNS